jgi:trans-aconitate 2-methyltransferase
VEPVEVYRQQAQQTVAAVTRHPVEAWPELPVPVAGRFDLILANHVFYYVPDLEAVVPRLLEALAPSGRLLTALAGQRNTLIQFWNRCFALIGRPVPYHTAEDLTALLARWQLPFRQQDVPYVLSFPDSAEHRLKILRFLLGNYFAEVPRQAMLDLFEPFAHRGTIVMPIVHEQYAIEERERRAPQGADAPPVLDAGDPSPASR